MKLTLDLCQKIAKSAQKKADELGISITVSIVDDAGRLILTLRGDGTGFLTPETSKAKATAAAAFRISTKEMVELQKSNPAFWQAIPSLAHGVLPSTGAVPIKHNGQIIGAIGCGGGTGEQDHECALAGAEAVLHHAGVSP
jgi:glc operon protein GlcG